MLLCGQKKLYFLMGPGWAKKDEIFDGSWVGKKQLKFLMVQGEQKKLKFLMGPGCAKKVVFFYAPLWAKKVVFFDGSGMGKKR